MAKLNVRSPARVAAATVHAALLLATACNQAPPAKSDAAQANHSTETASPNNTSGSAGADIGPAMLSTVGLYDVAPATDVRARQGRFTIRPGEQFKQLFVNGMPWQYVTEPGVPPAPIEANDDIQLIGVLELPRESVAWVLITGGTACAGTHVLVSIKDGRPIVGRGIPGCDDRGTIRRVDEHLVFEAGGSTGTYRDGNLQVTSSANEGALR